MNDCFWSFIHRVCEGNNCNGCKDYISVDSDKGVELLDDYESEVEEVLKPLADKWKQLKEQKNDN